MLAFLWRVFESAQGSVVRAFRKKSIRPGQEICSTSGPKLQLNLAVHGFGLQLGCYIDDNRFPNLESQGPMAADGKFDLLSFLQTVSSNASVEQEAKEANGGSEQPASFGGSSIKTVGYQILLTWTGRAELSSWMAVFVLCA